MEEAQKKLNKLVGEHYHGIQHEVVHFDINEKGTYKTEWMVWAHFNNGRIRLDSFGDEVECTDRIYGKSDSLEKAFAEFELKVAAYLKKVEFRKSEKNHPCLNFRFDSCLNDSSEKTDWDCCKRNYLHCELAKDNL